MLFLSICYDVLNSLDQQRGIRSLNVNELYISYSTQLRGTESRLAGIWTRSLSCL